MRTEVTLQPKEFRLETHQIPSTRRLRLAVSASAPVKAGFLREADVEKFRKGESSVNWLAMSRGREFEVTVQEQPETVVAMVIEPEEGPATVHYEVVRYVARLRREDSRSNIFSPTLFEPHLFGTDIFGRRR